MKKPLITMLALGGAMLLGQGSGVAQDSGAQAGASQNFQAPSDQDIEMLRRDIRSQKKQIIAQNMQLTDAEALKCPRLLYQSQCEFSVDVLVSAGMRSGAGDGV